MAGADPSTLADARATLGHLLRRDAVIVGDVTLVSGARSDCYVDARRALALPDGFAALSTLVAERAFAWDATAVGGFTLGARLMATAALAGGAPVKAFFLQAGPRGTRASWSGPPPAVAERCLVVKDDVTTGGLIVQSIEAVQRLGLVVCGVLAVVDRLAGGGERIAAATTAPYSALVTIDEIFPRSSQRGSHSVRGRRDLAAPTTRGPEAGDD
jgi:orotate phosphoribosyltransferase